MTNLWDTTCSKHRKLASKIMGPSVAEFYIAPPSLKPKTPPKLRFQILPYGWRERERKKERDATSMEKVPGLL